ncbi:Dihydrolipoyllysine-residue succinyltransferase component of 2-oxoglutarate dehydrogenase complex [subsurface metagenome]
MAVEVIIPAMGLTVEKGTILEWLKSEGDKVEKGEPILEVEADKGATEVESPASGILRKILISKGIEVPIFTVVGVITAVDEELPEKYLVEKPAPSAVPEPPVPVEAVERPLEPVKKEPGEVKAAPAVRKLASEHDIDLSLIAGSGPEGTILKRDVEDYVARVLAGEKERVKASPIARKLAQREGIDLTAVTGSGVGGRIMKKDVLAAGAEKEVEEKPTFKFGETVPMTKMRRVIAQRMTASFTTPHIYFFNEVNMQKLLKLRNDILPDFEKRFNIRISVNDFLIKVVALTIRDYPILNATVADDQIKIFPEINVGLAVALDEGLIVPAIPNADKMGLEEIAVTREDLTNKARAGKLTVEEIGRGTFTVSSLAQYDITFFAAILNPPQSGILSVGKTEEKPIVIDGEVVIRPIMNIGVSVDHRIVDGQVAAAFLREVKRKLEDPYPLFSPFDKEVK